MRNNNTLSVAAMPFYSLINSAQSSDFSISSSTIVIFCYCWWVFFPTVAILIGVRRCLIVVLIYISLMIIDVMLSIFSCAVSHLYFFFGKIFTQGIQVLCPFFNQAVYCWVAVLCRFSVLTYNQICDFLFFSSTHGLLFTLLLCSLMHRSL